jgi:hypothetical protein
MKVMDGDPAVMRDKRRIYKGDMSRLKGFDWNSSRPLDSVLKVSSTVETDRSSGMHQIALRSFVCTDGLAYPDGATHYEIFGSVAAVDFDAGKYNGAYASNGIKPLDGKKTGAVKLDFSLKPGGSLPVVLGLGVVFYQEGLMMRSGGCFGIVEVDWLKG